jgi:Holliday junction resolvase RusA-like endonuclease
MDAEGMVSVLRLTILMEPVGKGRARVVRRGDKVHSFTPDKTASAERLIREEWQAQGRVRLPDEALYLALTIYQRRPKGHWTSKGDLSAAGKRAVYPTGRPDLDNIAKLITDSLNGFAWRDDAQIALLRVERQWSDDQRVIIFAAPLVEAHRQGWT